MKEAAQPNRRQVLLCVLALMAVNLAIVGKLFGVEYTAYNGSIEPTFIAIARLMAKHPGSWNWWRFWSGGMPFETAYLPFQQWVVAAFSLITRFSAARSFHIVTAAFYVLTAPTLFWMALEFSRKIAASFAAALACSCLSLSTLLVPAIRMDAGGAFHLRRLQILVAYGEAPHTVVLALVPIAIVCFSRALTRPDVKWKILAGVTAAAVVLCNAFGIVALGSGLLCWMLAFRPRPWWKAIATIAAIGIASYCWIAPWLSFRMIHAIRANSSTSGGDYRYTPGAWVALVGFVLGYLLLWLILRKLRVAPYLQFFALAAYAPTAFVTAWYVWNVAIIPQAHRYQLQMDLALTLALVFAGAFLLERFPPQLRIAISSAAFALLAVLSTTSALYGWQLIRHAQLSQMSEYRVAKWLDQHRPGERAFLPGSTAFWYNDFTDNPQLVGGHMQFAVNPFLAIVEYTIYFGTNAGDRDADYSIFWLKAFGARTISVSGPKSSEYYRSYTHPRKFEGLLPVLWHQGDDTIYEVPGRSPSLAHVIPASAVVKRAPVHGLDTGPVEAYVAALDDPRYPIATFRWTGMSDAEIHADTQPGQVVAVQVTYDRGWEAWSSGKRLRVRGDGIGQMVIEPVRSGTSEIRLRYTGGMETTIQRGMSLSAMMIAVAYIWSKRRESTASKKAHAPV